MDKTSGLTTQLQPWLDLLRAGDHKAREQIIEHSCQRLQMITRKMLRKYPSLRRWEQTEDVLQNALVRLHRSLAEVHPESVGKFLGLAATQIRRALIDLVRHHYGPAGPGKHHQTAGQGAAADDFGGPLHGQAGPTDEPETLEAWTAFHEAVGRLPNDEREVFDLLWYEGMTQAEAASALGVTERTINRRWQSARYLLYETLKGQEPE